MFVIFATKALNDNTKGFRFNFFGTKGLVRIRKIKSRGYFKVEKKQCMTALHLGKITVYKEHAATMRMLRHFAG